MTQPTAAATLPDVDPQATPSPAPPARSLANVTADGAMWMLVVSLVTRVLSVISQLVLTRLLMPEELGVVGLAQFVASIAAFIGTLGILQFLIARQAKIERYADTAFWLSLSLGLVNSLFLVLAAPVAVWMYHDPRLYGLLIFNACTAPIGAIGVVPNAIAGISLRFKLTAYVVAVSMVAQVVVSILAAALGFGPYSIFFGSTAAAAVRVAVQWRALSLKFPFTPRYSFRAERVLLGSTSGWIVGTGVLANLLGQGDYATMGFFFSKTEIGYYYFAYNLAQQAVVLFGSSLGSVLYPAVASLGADRHRQAAAVLRAVRMLTLLGAPGGLLLVFCMPTLVHVFGAQYLPATPIAQIMAAGAIALLAASPSVALINAQGRFRFYFFHTLVMTALFMLLVLIGCLTRHVLGVATAVAVFFWIGGPLGMMFAIDGFRVTADTARKVVRAIGEPAAWCLPATAVSLLLFSVMGPGTLVHEMVRSAVTGSLFLLIALPTLWFAMPGPARELLAVGRGVMNRLPFARLRPQIP